MPPFRAPCARHAPGRVPVLADLAYTEALRLRLIRPGPGRLVRHLRDTLGDRTRRAQPHVLLTHPPGQHGPAVAHALVVRVRRAALASAHMPVAGQRGAPGLDRGADRRIYLVQ